MTFHETYLKGVFKLKMSPHTDSRGYFARMWCNETFEEKGLIANIKQSNVSFNEKKDTLRGMHYQNYPYEETKIVQCARGGIFDVVIDIRKDSQTFGQYYTIELYENDLTLLYIPKGFAHGFQTLKDNTEVIYFMDREYVASAATGIRWDDPYFNIEWPHAEKRIISAKDLQYPDFDTN